MTYIDVYKKIIAELEGIYSTGEAIAIANRYLENKLGTEKFTETLKMTEVDTVSLYSIEQDIAKLKQHQPLQQVMHEAWFYNLEFYVNEHVLIPRPETEELVELILNESRIKNEKLEIIDIGTGSGCIPITIKSKCPDVIITAIDVSSAALHVAKKNAGIHQTSIEFLQLDFLNEENWNMLDMFDIVVSNPPYISIAEKDKMDKNVVDWEPHLALFVSENNPIIFYEKIAAFAQTHLKKDGKLFVEIHQDYAKETLACFQQKFNNCKLLKDISGNYRMIEASQPIFTFYK